MRTTTTLGAMVFVLTGGCVEPLVPVGQDPIFELPRVVDIPPEFNPDLDLLFVVDNSAGMQLKQEELAASLQRLIAQLEFFEYEGEERLPNLHIGVVSADMGVGATYSVESCDALGDQAVLQGLPAQGDAPAERFVRDIALGQDRDTNYQGAIEDTLAGMVELGGGGCVIAQPLEAMRMALDGSNLQNQGFLRDQAALAVVLVSNQDDCSISDDSFFDPADNDRYSPELRCFIRGAQCNDDDVIGEGTYRGCHASAEPEHMVRFAEYSDFLYDLKSNDSIVVGGLIGGATEASIVRGADGMLAVSSRCDEGYETYPAVRLQAFIDTVEDESAFVGRGSVSSQCGPAAESALGATGKQIRKMLGTRCMDGQLRDVDPNEDGIQPLCQVSMTSSVDSVEIPACTAPRHMPHLNDAPCYYIDEGGCGDYFGTQHKLFVWWGRDADGSWRKQPGNVTVSANCLLDEL